MGLPLPVRNRNWFGHWKSFALSKTSTGWLSVWDSSLRFRQDNAFPCNLPLEYGGSFLSKNSGAAQVQSYEWKHTKKQLAQCIKYLERPESSAW